MTERVKTMTGEGMIDISAHLAFLEPLAAATNLMR